MMTRRRKPAQRGTVLIMVAILGTALLGMAALAIDSAFIAEVRTEVQNVVDVTSTAAASGLVVSQAEGNARAETFAALNPVLGTSIDLVQQDVTYGLWDAQLNQFFPTTVAPNSARVSVRLSEETRPGAPALFFAPILGQQRMPVAATATAALGNRSVMLVLDHSGSMNDDNANPEQPLTATKEAAKVFVDLVRTFPIEGDRMGLVFYNQDASLDRQLTEDFNQVKAAIDVPNANGCTNIAAAVCTARQELFSSRAPDRAVEVVVLLSDGRTNTRINPVTCRRSGSGCQDPFDQNALPGALTRAEQQALDQARALADQGAILYTISLGLLTNQTLMRQMAQEANGEHFFAPTTDDLEDVFNQISSRIPIALVE